jgi:hypothetical protein
MAALESHDISEALEQMAEGIGLPPTWYVERGVYLQELDRIWSRSRIGVSKALSLVANLARQVEPSLRRTPES